MDFLPKFNDDQEAIFSLLPTASSIYSLNREQEKRTNVFTLVDLPQIPKNIGPETQISIFKTTMTRFLLQGSRVKFLH